MLYKYTGRCPSCDSSALTLTCCDRCPVLILEEARDISRAGRLLEQVLEHEFDVKHYKIDIGSVSCEIRDGLKILENERSKWEDEMARRREAEAEHNRVMENFARRQR